VRTFAGIDLSVEAVPDATTLLKFRHLLEAHALTAKIFAEVAALLGEKKLLMREGTIVDATIIAALPRRRTRARSATPRCTRSRKATSGTSA
jgi:IS5 family transposase